MKKKPTHGGKRPGAGRPEKPPTKTLSYRVPSDAAQEIDMGIRKLIAKYIKKKSG